MTSSTLKDIINLRLSRSTVAYNLGLFARGTNTLTQVEKHFAAFLLACELVTITNV